MKLSQRSLISLGQNYRGLIDTTRKFSTKVVTLKYDDLIQGKDLSASIDEAYNFDGVGLLTVSDVPQLLPLRFETHLYIYQSLHITHYTNKGSFRI